MAIWAFRSTGNQVLSDLGAMVARPQLRKGLVDPLQRKRHVSQVTKAEATSPLKGLYAPVQDEMDRVEQILREEMSSKYAYVDELVRYGCMLGGKRLRPALLLLTAKALDNVTEDHYKLAAVVEMIHTATLIHDDVLDKASVRRHLATVNARWDSEASVLLGDFLFTHAFYLASTTESTHACQIIGRSTNRVCEGEIRQKGSKADFELSERDYFEIIEAKTAELCACCCELGAHYADADEETVRQLTAFGRELGIAFQIADDLLDLQGSEDETGKTLGTDLESQKPTLPIIHALANADSESRTALLSVLNGPVEYRLEGVRPFLARYESLQYTREMAHSFAHRSAARLECLAPSEATSVLQAMPEFVVLRSR